MLWEEVMRDGYCVKCEQATVKERISQVAGLPTHIFVCSTCGYLETYVLEHILPALIDGMDWQNVPLISTSRAATSVTVRLRPKPDVTTSSSYTTTEQGCPICNSTRLIPNVRVRATGIGTLGDLAVEVERFPNATFIRGVTEGWLSAVVCSECGYTVLFADNTDELYLAYREVKR